MKVELQSNFQLRVERHQRLLLVLLYFALWLVKITRAIDHLNQSDTKLTSISIWWLFLPRALIGSSLRYFLRFWWVVLLALVLLKIELKSPQIKSGITIQTEKQISRNRSICTFQQLGRNHKQALCNTLSLMSTLVIMGGFHSNSLNLNFFPSSLRKSLSS